MKEFYVNWINEDEEQVIGRKPHDYIRADGELTEAETEDEAIENVRQWIIDQIGQWKDDNGDYYTDWEIDETDGDIIVWDTSGDEKKLIAAYIDFAAREYEK